MTSGLARSGDRTGLTDDCLDGGAGGGNSRFAGEGSKSHTSAVTGGRRGVVFGRV